MLTYRTFIDGETLIKELKNRFNYPPPKTQIKSKKDADEFFEFKKNVLDAIRLRIIQTLKYWLEKFYKLDFLYDKKLLDALNDFILEMDKAGCSNMSSILKSTINRG